MKNYKNIIVQVGSGQRPIAKISFQTKSFRAPMLDTLVIF